MNKVIIQVEKNGDHFKFVIGMEPESNVIALIAGLETAKEQLLSGLAKHSKGDPKLVETATVSQLSFVPGSPQVLASKWTA